MDTELSARGRELAPVSIHHGHDSSPGCWSRQLHVEMNGSNSPRGFVFMMNTRPDESVVPGVSIRPFAVGILALRKRPRLPACLPARMTSWLTASPFRQRGGRSGLAEDRPERNRRACQHPEEQGGASPVTRGRNLLGVAFGPQHLALGVAVGLDQRNNLPRKRATPLVHALTPLANRGMQFARQSCSVPFCPQIE